MVLPSPGKSLNLIGKQSFNGTSGGILFRTLFAAAAADTHHLVIEPQLNLKMLVMIRAAFTHQHLGKNLILFLLHLFL